MNDNELSTAAGTYEEEEVGPTWAKAQSKT